MTATAVPRASFVPAQSREASSEPAPAAWLPPAGRVVLGVPLALKLAGANALVVVAIGAAAWAHGLLTWEDFPLLALVVGVSMAISTTLAILALEPVRALERTAREILAGDMKARVRVSVLADRDVRRIAHVMNELISRLTSERERIRELALRVVSAEDGERARAARELEDSTAQALAAILYEIRGEIDRTADPQVKDRLERLADMSAGTIEELRSVTSSMHPRVLTDLGLVPALEWLARGVRNRHDIVVNLSVPRPAPRLPSSAVAVLFAVAREALARAAARPGTSRIDVGLSIDEHYAQLVVSDNGSPVPDEASADALPVLRERVGLVNGSVSLEQTSDGGTAALAIIPTGAM